MRQESSGLRALVLDAQYSHALASVRSLGSRGIEVSAASYKAHADGLCSRFCTHALVCPSPNTDRQAFVQWLHETLSRQRYDATLFFDEATADILSEHRESIQALTGCPLPPRETFLTASRKDRVADLAQDLGIPVPTTRRLDSEAEIEPVGASLRFPVVIKGVHSSGGQQVALAANAAEFSSTVQRIAALRKDPALPLPVVQEFIPGTGYGLTSIMHAGEALAVFMHRRLEEHDIGNNVRFAHGSTAAESVDEPELRHLGLRLLQALAWEGIAMVEFRRDDRDGRFVFLEVNPRFVGSLDLAIAAGVDLPWAFVRLAAGDHTALRSSYHVGMRYRWLLSKNVAYAFEHPGAYARGVLSTLRPGTRCDLWLRDPKPHWSQLRDAAWWLRHQWRSATIAAGNR